MIDYKEEEKKKRIENLNYFREHITDRSFMIKVKKWAEKNDLHFEYVKHKVFTDEAFALNFIKEPSRQNLHEDLAAYEIRCWEELIIGDTFKVLPKGGKEAKVINKDGEIIYLEESNQSEVNTKTIDFQWEICLLNTGEVFTCYASHKHTKESGGAQDNQYNDIKTFMQLAKLNKDKNTIFLAICDGEYYQQKDTADKTKTKIEMLNQWYSVENKLIALTIHELKNTLQFIICT